jgi:hypothetical protein
VFHIWEVSGSNPSRLVPMMMEDLCGFFQSVWANGQVVEPAVNLTTSTSFHILSKYSLIIVICHYIGFDIIKCVFQKTKNCGRIAYQNASPHVNRLVLLSFSKQTDVLSVTMVVNVYRECQGLCCNICSITPLRRLVLPSYFQASIDASSFKRIIYVK